MYRCPILNFNNPNDHDRVRFGGALPADEIWRRYAAGQK
jgi:hypothetical protein